MNLALPVLRAGATLLSPAGARARLSILMYHRVLPAPDPLTDATDAATFDAHLAALARCMRVLPLVDAIDRLAAGRLPPRALAITFDDGYADNATLALPLLQRYRLPATFFIADGFLGGGRMFNDTVIEAIRRMPGPALDVPAAGLTAVPVGTIEEKRAAVGRTLAAVKHLDDAARHLAVAQVAHAAGAALPDDLMMTPEQVRSLAASGMTIGGHTVRHPILTRIAPERARVEIETNRARLQTLSGQPVEVFAYPNGVPNQDYAAEHVAMVRAAGFRGAVSTAWGAATRGSDPFQLPRFTPWDRAPARFLARLLHNLAARRTASIAA
jgi:peptidoglycan/xylan/chitin deacetylase (PgdA/CDA1 family)